jgi:two-component system, chemotaxis family, chemotaxis protein CheY
VSHVRSTSVLIVEDVPLMGEVVSVVAKKAGFTDVDQVSGGLAALKRLHEKNYGLVISDLEMDDMNGVELLQAVRQDARLKHTPFIMITAYRKSKHIIAARDADVDSVLIKPFTPTQLREKIELIWARAAAVAAH